MLKRLQYRCPTFRQPFPVGATSYNLQLFVARKQISELLDHVAAPLHRRMCSTQPLPWGMTLQGLQCSVEVNAR